MAGARRRLNYTGRQRIRREHIEIQMLETAPGAPLKAKVGLSLDGYSFPDTAMVILEAYHSSSGMRFELGSVSKFSNTHELELSEVDHVGNVNFRLKVIDTEAWHGRVLGSAERLQAKSNEDDEAGDRRSLMTVHFQELGQEIWRIDVAPDSRPALLINQKIPDIKNRMKQDAVIQAFLLPAALRIVLENLFVDDGYGDDEDDAVWQKDWKEYCKTELGVPFEGTSDIASRNEWVDRCVQLFCRHAGLLKNLKKQLVEL
tara:strand:+ start:209479 stop:210255 length:777 start_codon:yes stop_codon:yes gene_type:complete